MSIRHFKYPNIQEKLHSNYDPLRQKYLKAILSGKKAVNVDMYMKFISATRERYLVTPCTKTMISL